LSTTEKTIVKNKSAGSCALCKSTCKKCEYDHITPLANGGSNDISNFQLLCVHCHLKKTIQEKRDGSHKLVSKVHSSFNNVVFEKVVSTKHFKSYQFVERIQPEIEKLPCFKVDGRRFRKNILYYSDYEFPVYSVMDHPKKFSGEIQCGYYYVNTYNIFPLRGCGWYCQAIVEYCLRQQLLREKDILYEFIPSTKLPCDHFQKMIEYLIRCFDDPKFQKTVINALIGCWGIQMNSSTHSKFSIAEDEASQWLVDHDNVRIEEHKIGEDNDITLFEAKYENSVAVDDNAYPLYSMILQMEAMELHKLEQLVIENDGIPLDRNTDAIRYQKKKEINFEEFYWDEKKRYPKYQREENKPLKHEAKRYYYREGYLKDAGEFECEWDIKYDMTAVEIFESKQSALINGRAGTGKTTLVNQLIELIKQGCEEGEENYYDCLAPTNKSARLIHGQTIDSLHYKSVFNNKKLVSWAKKLKYLIVDEISMVKEKFYRMLSNIKKINPRIIFYICGDFEQLEPVEDTWEGDYENTTVLKDLCDKNKVLLTICRRSDSELFNLCKNVEFVNVNEFQIKTETYLNIAFTHKTRKLVNQKCMERFLLQNPNQRITEIPPDENHPKSQFVKLIKGTPIICHRTNKKLDILNSDRFTITSTTNDSISLTNEMRIETRKNQS
jgi:hypothetical protein